MTILFCLLVVSFFGVVGFIFSICFAFTTAAESGALAGLGLTFVSNLLAFEVSKCRMLLLFRMLLMCYCLEFLF